MPFILHFSGYLLVSAIALSVDFGLFLALTGLMATEAVSTGIFSYSAGLILHFLLSKRFVFSDRHNKHVARLFAEYALSGVAGIALTAATMKLAIEGLSVSPVAAKLIAVGVSFVVVYLLRKTIVFAEYAR
ncbi:MAG: polysaccharide biosynthesis protein GtrA [Hyphomicrobiales bacterium]|nr:MAG: polysaccharide biosynthesis protein GtrA [Hyphomicrobiales bacterium]